jgi:HSP20 family protein
MMSHLIPRRQRRSAVPAIREVRGFDDLVDELWRGFGLAPLWQDEAYPRGFTPRLDVKEEGDAIVVSVELPGLEEKDFDVSLEKDVLTIKGEKRTEHKEERKGFHHVETTAGSFERRLRLPCEVDAEHVTASYKNGVVSVVLPRPPEARQQTRTIPVTTS